MRGLQLPGRRKLSAEARSVVRALREAAIAQYQVGHIRGFARIMGVCMYNGALRGYKGLCVDIRRGFEQG